jgi:hypothetical protein
MTKTSHENHKSDKKQLDNTKMVWKVKSDQRRKKMLLLIRIIVLIRFSRDGIYGETGSHITEAENPCTTSIPFMCPLCPWVCLVMMTS